MNKKEFCYIAISALFFLFFIIFGILFILKYDQVWARIAYIISSLLSEGISISISLTARFINNKNHSSPKLDNDVGPKFNKGVKVDTMNFFIQNSPVQNSDITQGIKIEEDSSDNKEH